MAYSPNTQFAEDAAHTSGDVGTEMLGVRNDSATVRTSTDGDYSPQSVTGEGYTLVASGWKQLTGSAAALNADAIASTDVAGYRWVMIQNTNTYTGTMQIQFSNDNTNWAASTAHALGATSGLSTTLAASSISQIAVHGRYMRVRMSAYTSGTSDINVMLYALPGTQNALSSLGGVTLGADNADGVAASATGNKFGSLSRNTVYNGTTWDLQRGNTSGIFEQGNVANAVADAGNPVKIGGKYNSTLPTFTDGQRADVQVGARGSLHVELWASDSGNSVAAATPGDAAGGASSVYAAAFNQVFNGTNWDRARGMSVATTTGDSGAKVATGNGATQTNVGNKGVQLFIVLGTVSGTGPTCVFKLQGSTDGGTNFYDIPGAATASLAASTNVGMMVYPGIVATAASATSGTILTLSSTLPRTWRVVWTIGGTAPSFAITSITYNYLPN